jgi:uncharacterized oligopeptide transporter (OPT) family protein
MPAILVGIAIFVGILILIPVFIIGVLADGINRWYEESREMDND